MMIVAPWILKGDDMIALSAIQHNPLIRQLYEKHRGQGTHKMAVLGICMHKILRIVYDMLKHNKSFDPRIESLDKDIVLGSTSAVHTDGNVMLFQQACKIITGKLGSLICVKDFRGPVAADRLLYLLSL
jgi:hypothetical protein